MNENELKARFQHAVIGEDNTSTSSIPKKGEIIFNNTLDNFRVGTDGNTPYSSLNDFLRNFTGANTSNAGTAGLVLAPAQKTSGEADKFLCDDGSWKVVSSSSGTDTHYYTSLNGTNYGDTGGVNLGSWYAPVNTGDATNKYLYWNNDTGHLKPEWGTLSDLGIYSRDFKHALNGASSGNTVGTVLRTTDSDFTFPIFYAPITGGTSANQLLISQGSSSPFSATAPVWTNFTLPSSGTTKTLNYVGGTGWTLQELMSATITGINHHGHLLFHPYTGGNQEMKYNTLVYTGIDGGTLGYILAGNTNDSTDLVYFQGDRNCPILMKYGSSGNIDSNKIIHSSGVINAPTGSSGTKKILSATMGSNNAVTFNWNTIGTGLTIVNNNLQLSMPLWPSGVTLSDLGGIKTKGGVVNEDPVVATSGTYYAVQTDSTGVAMVRIPSGTGYGTVTSIGVDTSDGLITNGANPITTTGTIGLRTATATSGKGSLIVAADKNSDDTYINTEYSIAVPVFYGKTTGTTYYYQVDGEEESPYSKGSYVPGTKFTGHYVNIHDIVNGLIRNSALLSILRNALEIKQ